MKVLVLGAGVIGVTAAYELAGAGHEVVVVDRQAAPALETSFANAGEVSPGYSAPWAGPGVGEAGLEGGRALAVNDRDFVAGAGELVGRGHADDAGTENQHLHGRRVFMEAAASSGVAAILHAAPGRRNMMHSKPTSASPPAADLAAEVG